MKNIKLIILYFIFCFLGVSSLKSQNNFYEKIHDDVKFDMVPELEQKAQEISNLIEVNEGSSAFKVLSAEEYFILGHQNEFDKNQFSSTVSNAIGSRNNFLLFQKYFIPIDGEGINKKYTVHYNVAMFLPPGAPFATNKLSGIQNGIIKLLQSKMDSETGPQLLNEKIAEAELEALEYFKNKIECLIYGSETEDCSLEIELLRYKFRKFDIQVGEASAISTFGEDNIFDYFGKKVLILGIEGIDEYVDIADQIRENKKIIDAGFTVTNEDTTLFSNPVSGRVFILTADQFINNGNGSVWDGILNTAGDYDYTECWVILENNNGKTELYSKFTIGQFSGSGIGAVRDDGQGERSITPSPWGLALKALGNAALYACMEAVTNRLTDEKINDWGAAFGSVSIAGAAWEGVSSLIPWKKTKLDNVMIAISNGLGVVIEKASKGGSNYTVQNGLSDFLTAVGTSLLTQWLGPKIIDKGPKILQGFTRLVKYSDNKKVNEISGKCFSTILMKYGCFTEDTPIYLNETTQKKISDIQIGEYVLSVEMQENLSVNITENFYPANQLESQLKRIVQFISLDSQHTCQMLLSQNQIQHFQIQNIDDLVWLNIPEQGIFGTFKVTSIKHYIPPKIPVENKLSKDFVLSPVSAIFTHVSDDVWKLTFDKDETIEVTSAHPFLHADGYWVAAGNLKGGDQIRTKDGYRTLTSIEKLEGSRTVYNITVAGTHTYLVGQDGLVVHNTCGNLDDLATRFINNFSKAIKKNEINTWWATGYPKFFKRGTFFEKLMARSPKYTGWTLTPHTWPVIDFQKRIGNTIKVISMKTTITSNVNDWMSTNSNHLIKLNNLQIATAQNGGGLPEIRALHIFVKDSELSNFSNWASVIKSKYPNIKEVVLNSIEKEFNL